MTNQGQRITRFIVTVMAILATSGCAPDPGAAQDEVARQVESHRQLNNATAGATQPMLGRWKIDVEATLHENPFLSNPDLAIIRRDLERNPFELEITPTSYTSRSALKTESDHYLVSDVKGGVVTLNLQSAEHDDDSHQRKVRLMIRDGSLIIRTGGSFSCVMIPSPAASE